MPRGSLLGLLPNENVWKTCLPSTSHLPQPLCTPGHWVVMAAPLNWKGTCLPALSTSGSIMAESEAVWVVCQGRAIERQAGLGLLELAVVHSRQALTDQVGSRPSTPFGELEPLGRSLHSSAVAGAPLSQFQQPQGTVTWPGQNSRGGKHCAAVCHEMLPPQCHPGPGCLFPVTW